MLFGAVVSSSSIVIAPMRFLFFLIVSLGLFCVPVLGQRPLLGHKAEKWNEKAVFYEMHHQPEKAITYFKKSLRRDPGNLKTHLALSELYFNLQDFKEAAQILKEAASTSPGALNQVGYPLANALFRSGDYSDAQKVLSKLRNQPDLLKSEDSKIALLRESVRFARQNIAEHPSDTPLNLGMRVNSIFNDLFPSINADDSILIFISATNGVDQDFYRAKRDSCGGWFAALPLGEPPNSPQQEGPQSVSADGHYLFFTRCQNRSPNGWEGGGCDLFFSYTQGEGWAQPVPFGATINTPSYEGMPSLSPDNKTLYFVSDRPGGYGGKDIWMSRFENGLWQVPENLGSEINTSGDETAPYIAVDNATLYFTSNGHPGFGGSDLFLSRKQPDGSWGKPFNLGRFLNSPSDDVSITVNNDGKTAYFASNRPGGLGAMDIYRVTLPEDLRPEPQTFVYGIVKDSLAKSHLPKAILTWTNAHTGEEIAQYESNRGDGSFISAFPLNFELALHVSRYGYLNFRDTFCFNNQHIYPFDTLNIALLPESYQPPLTDTTLLTLHFKKNTFTLNDSLRSQIMKIVKPFKLGKYNEFYVNGFTDTSGYHEINEDISTERANVVMQVLVDMGISENKIQAHGWADSNPVAPNNTEEGRAENRRVELILRLPKK